MLTVVKSVLNDIDKKIADTRQLIDKAGDTKISFKAGQTLEDYEHEICELSRTLAGLLTARALQDAIVGEEIQQAVNDLLKYTAKYRNVGWRLVAITLKSGMKVSIAAPYYARRCGGKDRKGFYPRCVPAHLGLMTSV